MSENLIRTNTLTDRLLRSWLKCKRRAWLDLYGEAEQRLWTAHRTLQLDHQHRSFVALIPSKPGKGLQACQRGDLSVVGLRLRGSIASGKLLEAHPPLLQKVSGKSCSGNFAYRPVIAKQGRKITRENRLLLSLTGFLLESIQQSPVENGLVISISTGKLQIEQIILRKNLQQQLLTSFHNLSNDLNQREAPPITSDRR